jgi:polyhydroxyalkanoate synthesis regulator phasin
LIYLYVQCCQVETITASQKKSRGKGKGKVAPPDEEEQGDEDKISFDEDAAEEQEKVTRSALFSINVIDLKAPPLPLKHGEWNDRPINLKAMKRLKDSFRTKGICAFDLDNALPLILPREHLDPDAINNSIGDPEQAPMLRLTEEGMKSGVLKFAGGHHRYKLIIQQWESKQKTLTAMESKLEKKKKTMQSKQDKRTNAPLDDLHEDIDELENQIQGIKRSTLWAVKVYDASK